MSNAVLLIIIAVLSYAFGNVNWARIISGLRHKDITKMGSGNPGTLNMSRNFGLKFGLLTFFLDILKGVLPTLLSYLILSGKTFRNSDFYVSDLAIYLSGLCVVLGHIYPVAFKFKGGKCIASTIGVFLVCEFVHGWQWGMVNVMALIAAAVFIYITEFGAMGSFIAITPPAIGGSIRLYLTYAQSASDINVILCIIVNMLIFSICLFTWFAHRKNIERMLSGDEHPTSIKSMVVKRRAEKLQKKQENKS